MKNPFHRQPKFLEKTLDFLHLHKNNPREKYLRISLQILLLIAVFLAGYLTAKLQQFSL